jgi:TrpR-related protein YerC/YecD
MPQPGIDQAAKNAFFAALSKIKNEANFEHFLRDLMSSSEIKDLSRRFYAARLLKQKKTYQEIEMMMGMSAGTVNKIYFKTKGSKILPDLV